MREGLAVPDATLQHWRDEAGIAGPVPRAFGLEHARQVLKEEGAATAARSIVELAGNDCKSVCG